MKTIKQLSTEFGISKEAIYKKLKFQLREELTGHVFKVDGITRVDEEGERLMRQSLHHERRAAIENVIDGVLDVELVEDQGQSHMNEYVNLLREQVKEKDIQIETQSGHIGQLIRQLGMSQLLSLNRRPAELALASQDGGQAGGVKTARAEQAKTVKKSVWNRIFRNRRKVTQ